MQASVDGGDFAAAARVGQASGAQSQYAAAQAFAQPELLSLDEVTLRGWLETPDFAPYRVKLSRVLRRKPHVRSAEVEALLGALQSPFATERSIHPTLVNMDMQFGTAGGVPITQGNEESLQSSSNRAQRREAWENYADAHLAAQHAQAAMYIANVQQNIFLARARHYPDAITAALAPDGIPTEVVDTLLTTYRAHTPIWHAYWDVRRRYLGLDKLREYDVKAPLTPPSEVTYAQAVTWLSEGMAPLGEEYVRAMQRGLTRERWVDYAQNAGKRQGAYSNGSARVKPYIFMTWNGGLRSYSTLAHEVGHSMHSLLADEAQPPSVPRYTLFHAEVASNFNQAMTRQYLLRRAREEGNTAFEIEVLEEALSNFHRYFFIMPTLAAFELEAYRRVQGGQSPSAQS